MNENNLAFIEEKKLYLCTLDLKEVVASCVIPKTPTRIEFRNDELIVADKFGDVYSYKVTNSSLVSDLLLGHVSLVTDFLLKDDLIYTSDRDEKIRASQFPKAYNIEFFCFGHEEYVSRLVSYNDYVVSGGGDTFLAVWKGDKLIEKIDLKQIVGKDFDVDVLDLAVFNDKIFVLLENFDFILIFKDFKLETKLDSIKPKRILASKDFLYVVAVDKVIKYNENLEIVNQIELEISDSYFVSHLRKSTEGNYH